MAILPHSSERRRGRICILARVAEKPESESKKQLAAAEEEARQRYVQVIEEIREGSRKFNSDVRSQSGIVLEEFIDPEGEAVATLAEVEGDAGALALAMPLDLITFETWLFGQIGDQDELDFDIPRHKELWFSLGAWIGETMRLRHGGHWLFAGDDPRGWRLGFSKIMLEVVPHLFAEQLLRMGQGAVKKLLAEIERIRLGHEEQKEADKGKEIDRFTPQHYVRMHTMPLGQWMVMDFKHLDQFWNKGPTSGLIEEIKAQGDRLGTGNQQVIEKVTEALLKADQDKPLGEQTGDRGLFEAIAQIVALRRTTQPVAMDILESLVMPTIHIGLPEEFPELDEDDISRLHKGIEFFALFVDIVPHKHQAWDDGFLGTIPNEDLATPYRDKTKLEVGKGDWVIVNPQRFVEMMSDFSAEKLLERYDVFIKHINDDENAPRRRDDGRMLAETVARSVADVKGCVDLSAEDGHVLMFRLLPPPG
jgi:hypothetical protein